MQTLSLVTAASASFKNLISASASSLPFFVPCSPCLSSASSPSPLSLSSSPSALVPVHAAFVLSSSSFLFSFPFCPSGFSSSFSFLSFFLLFLPCFPFLSFLFPSFPFHLSYPLHSVNVRLNFLRFRFPHRLLRDKAACSSTPRAEIPRAISSKISQSRRR